MSSMKSTMRKRKGRSRRISEHVISNDHHATPLLRHVRIVLTVFISSRESEASYLASLTDSLSAGTTWSRICDLIELENSQSKTLARTGTGTTDLGR